MPAHSLVFGGDRLFFLRKRHAVLFAAAAIFLLAAALLPLCRPILPAFGPAGQGSPVYVIDAGHGGEDGGAVSRSGIRESDINLAVAQEFDALLRFLGRDTVMTRTEDVSVYTEGAETLRQKKASDLRNRAALVNAIPDAVLVSIHQNSLPTVPSVRGAQVFFGAAEPSEALAQAVQAALNECVNSGGAKREKRIDASIYLMKSVSCPAILVECGFLSNDGEAERLRAPEHQKRLAAAIAAGLLKAEEAL